MFDGKILLFNRMQADHLIVFIKAPRVGTVKSRIARTAGAERALRDFWSNGARPSRSIGQVSFVSR
jgi:hypothetical protein